MSFGKVLGIAAVVSMVVTAGGEAGASPLGPSIGAPAPREEKGTSSAATPANVATAPEAPIDPRQEDFNRRVKESIERTKSYKVVYQDVLGEGPGQWDEDPRYPTDSVNCIIWFQLLLAEAYGRTPEEKRAVMDRVRYFDGHASFGFRKHYIDQWTELDPGPLQNVSFQSCTFNDQQAYNLELQPFHFMESIHFPCPLYHSDKTSVHLTLESGPGVVQCGDTLAPGYYALFPVASDRYLAKYAGYSGPMAQVHFVLLEVPPKPAAGAPQGARDPAKFRVWHASTGSGKVVETELGSYVLHMWELFRGYVVYRLNPSWDWRTAPPLDDEGKALVACEATVPGHAGPLFELNARHSNPTSTPNQ
jgi:hypothetical protein